jgi:hypothetical protein
MMSVYISIGCLHYGVILSNYLTYQIILSYKLSYLLNKKRKFQKYSGSGSQMTPSSNVLLMENVRHECHKHRCVCVVFIHMLYELTKHVSNYFVLFCYAEKVREKIRWT